MSTRYPLYGWQHVLAEAGASAVTHSNTASTDYVKEHLLDRRPGSLFSWSASVASPWIEVDRGAGTLEAVDRLLVPVGHNLSGSTITVKSGASSPASTTRATLAVASTALIDLAVTSNSDRYLRLEITGTLQYELPELWFTRRRQPTTGSVQPGWEDVPRAAIEQEELPGREAVFVLAPIRREYAVEHRDLGSTDLALYDELLAEASALPLWFWPPDDAFGPFLMRMVRGRARREQDHPAPGGPLGPRYRVALELREQVT